MPRRPMELSDLVALLDSAEAPPPARPNFIQHPQVQERFRAAEKNQQPPQGTSAGLAREFAQRNQPGFDAQPTLLWHPNVRLEQGQASAAFGVPAAPATYRVLIFGHGADGRFGFHESRLTTGK